MDKICQTCGDKGFSRPLIYCTECWDTVEHIYCLGLSVDDITKDFSWTCNSCKSADNLLPKILVYGNEPNEDAKFAGYGPVRISDPAQVDANAMQVVGPIWRGSFFTTDKSYRSLKEMEAFMPKTSYSNAVKIARSMKPSLYFHMKRRSTLWPKKFDDIGAVDSNIEIYILPAYSSGETDYNNLVEYMIEYDLAMTADLGGIKLTVFTSLELLAFENHKIQGKYYLWGTLKEKKSKRVLSKYIKSSAAKKKTAGIKARLKTKRKKTRNLASLLRLDCILPLKPNFNRARSKSGEKKNDLKQVSEVQDFNLVEVQIIEGNLLDEHRAPPSNAGLKDRPPLEDEQHIEHGTCMNPVIDIEKENSEASNFPSTAPTVPLELSAEESTRCGSIASTVLMEFNDKETTICGSIQNREVSVSVPATILEMAGEYHETSSSRFIQVGRYRFKSDLAPILSDILSNHGDIALGCTTEPTIPLEEICKVVQELKSLRLSDLRCHHVNRLKDVMQLADVVGIDVKWLFQRCNDLEKLVSHLSQYPTLKSELAQSKKDIKHKEELLSLKRSKVEKHQAELVAIEETFKSLEERTEKSDVVQSLNLIWESFRGKSAVDGLY